MSLKAAILEKNEGEAVEFAEYTNLIMDEMAIADGEISQEDQQFLEQFTECQFLSLNDTGLKSLKNLPNMPKLERLELSGNELSGGEVAKTIVSLYTGLVTLKLASNQLTEVDHVLPLKALSKLESLDVSGNPFCAKIATNKQEYQDKMRAQL